ncbi:MAG: death on curing protein [Microgenomates group bacterium Gr01-1014_7]|nr:MAG: death on curing protein [Microgenomates group bacterium Gr01-1014_7]
MKRVKYLTPEQAIFYQQKIIKETGGSLGLRDLGLLESAINRPKATFDRKDLYPKILDKAAALFHSMILNHPFLDGNKRTALAILYEFLKQNGYKLKATEKELIEFPLKIERKDMDMEEIAKWLKGHVKKLR